MNVSVSVRLVVRSGVKSFRARARCIRTARDERRAPWRNCRAAAAWASAIPAWWLPTDCPSPAGCPFLMLQKRLMMKGICARPRPTAAQRMKVCMRMIGAQAADRALGLSRRGVIRAAVRHAPQHARHALREHRLEHQVHEDQREPEMHPAPEFVHHPPGHLRKPVIDAGEQREDRPGRHDVMEMRDDVIGVVQVHVAGAKTQVSSLCNYTCRGI